MLTTSGTTEERVYQFVAMYLGSERDTIRQDSRLDGRLVSDDFWENISGEFDWEVWALKAEVNTVGELADQLTGRLANFCK